METLRQKPETIAIVPAAWSAAAERWLRLAMQHASLHDLKNQVQRQEAMLFHVQGDGELVGAMVLRVEGTEGVIVSAGGNLPGYDFTLDLLPHVEKLFINVKSVRIHTARPGLAKKLTALGYFPAEMVFVKDIQ